MITTLLVTAIQPVMSLDTLLNAMPELQGSSYGVTVTTLDGKTLFDRNGDKRLIPASNQKILSCLYAAHALGMDFRPETTITEKSSFIVVTSNGDPSLNLTRLREAGTRLQDRNKPVYAMQAFRPGVPPTWEEDDLVNRYAAPVTAFTIDQGAFRLEAEKGAVKPLPKEFGINVLRGVQTGDVRVRYERTKRRISVHGRLGEALQSLDTLAFVDPDEVAARFLGSRLLSGPVPSTPATTLNSFSIPGDTLPKLLADCLQPSDNHYAEQLLLMAAARQGLITNPSNPYPAAREGLTQFLTRTAGVRPGDVRPMDGSGLSRQNYVATRGLARSLQWATTQSWFPTFDAALAAPGSGTLRTRLIGSSFRGKTGTLSSVVGLSGYVQTASGDRVIVSIIINNTLASSAKVRDCADQIVRFVEQSPTLGTTLVYATAHGRAQHKETLSNTSALASAGNRIR